MRTFLFSLLVIGCSNTVVEPPPVVFEPLEPLSPIIGPIEVGIAVPVDDFFTHYLPVNATEPVSAISGADFRLHYAFIDVDTNWPFVMRAEGTPRALPEQGSGVSTAIAIAASADGDLHMVHDVDSAIHYVRLHPDGSFDAPIVLDTERSRDATLAIAPSGALVVAWTRDPVPDSGLAHDIVVTRGVIEGARVATFETPRVANADCCLFDGPPEQMSGPSISIGPDDAIHVIYEFSSFFATTIHYVREEAEAFSAPLVVADAAFSPCPALHVTPDGIAHITYIRDVEPSVFYAHVEDGAVVDHGALYTPESGRATLALMTFDRAGTMHVAVAESHGRLQYLAVEDEMTIVSIVDEEGSSPALTPRAGGFYVAPDGKPITAFSLGSEAQIAVGVPD